MTDRTSMIFENEIDKKTIQKAEKSKEENQKDDGLETTLGGEPQRSFQLVFQLLKGFLHPLMVTVGASFDGVVFCFCHNVLFFHCMK